MIPRWLVILQEQRTRARQSVERELAQASRTMAVAQRAFNDATARLEQLGTEAERPSSSALARDWQLFALEGTHAMRNCDVTKQRVTQAAAELAGKRAEYAASRAAEATLEKYHERLVERARVDLARTAQTAADERATLRMGGQV